jgi:hypothetical protein
MGGPPDPDLGVDIDADDVAPGQSPATGPQTDRFPAAEGHRNKAPHFLFLISVRCSCIALFGSARIALIGMSFPALLLLPYCCLFLPRCLHCNLLLHSLIPWSDFRGRSTYCWVTQPLDFGNFTHATRLLLLISRYRHCDARHRKQNTNHCRHPHVFPNLALADLPVGRQAGRRDASSAWIRTRCSISDA